MQSGRVRVCSSSPILLHLYGEYFTKEALENFGDFKISQVIHTVKYADGFVLRAKEEPALQGMIDSLIQFWKPYGGEMNVEKK